MRDKVDLMKFRPFDGLFIYDVRSWLFMHVDVGDEQLIIFFLFWYPGTSLIKPTDFAHMAMIEISK